MLKQTNERWSDTLEVVSSREQQVSGKAVASAAICRSYNIYLVLFYDERRELEGGVGERNAVHFCFHIHERVGEMDGSAGTIRYLCTMAEKSVAPSV